MKYAVAVCTGIGMLLSGIAYGDQIIGPNGKALVVVKCKANSQECYRQAGKICGGSYQVVDSESHAGGLLADILPGPVTWYSMVLQCGPSDGKMAAFERRGPEWRPPSMASCTASGQSVLCFGN